MSKRQKNKESNNNNELKINDIYNSNDDNKKIILKTNNNTSILDITNINEITFHKNNRNNINISDFNNNNREYNLLRKEDNDNQNNILLNKIQNLKKEIIESNEKIKKLQENNIIYKEKLNLLETALKLICHTGELKLINEKENEQKHYERHHKLIQSIINKNRSIENINKSEDKNELSYLDKSNFIFHSYSKDNSNLDLFNDKNT